MPLYLLDLKIVIKCSDISKQVLTRQKYQDVAWRWFRVNLVECPQCRVNIVRLGFFYVEDFHWVLAPLNVHDCCSSISVSSEALYESAPERTHRNIG